ncbi:MAG: hypothetical protein P8X91_00745, partial [Candidatus Bathyarchaeota archaeon]
MRIIHPILVFLLSFLILSIPSVFGSSVMWSQTYGSENQEVAHWIVETSDGGYAISGYTNSFGDGSYDSWLIKTDVNGNMLWNKTYGG